VYPASRCGLIDGQSEGMNERMSDCVSERERGESEIEEGAIV